ncbi:MAG: carbon-nitrogen hydrolase family protein [Acidobacteria bacterium]|nr:carbon-nitrogen hydrolase family protein [Acidobacteriota bacterium]
MRFKAPKPILSRPVRVTSIQYALRRVASFEAFSDQVEAFVDVGDDYDSDLVVFPELLTAQLISCLPKSTEPAESMRELAERYTEAYDALFMRLARDYDRILVAGSHPRKVDGKLMNVAGIFVPGHEPVLQPKLHLTPTERKAWKYEPGHELHVVDTDFGRFAATICYDIQFPEVGRVLAENGVQILCVPYLTDDRRGWNRVTLCARARAVENQLYVVTSGMVGSLPLITDLTAQYAQSGIYTPTDYFFPHDGVATEASVNTEMVAVADLDLALLDQARAGGSVLNHADAAQDGLHVRFDGMVKIHRLPWLSAAESADPGSAAG